MSTESQIGLGDGVEVEVGDHVDEVEVYEVVDLELDLEEGELDLACSLEHRLVEDREGVHEQDSHGAVLPYCGCPFMIIALGTTSAVRDCCTPHGP